MKKMMIGALAVAIVAGIGGALLLRTPSNESTPVAGAGVEPAIAPVPEALSQVLDAYEDVREHLAQDRRDGFSLALERMTRAATHAVQEGPDTLRDRLAALAYAARRLEAAKRDDFTPLRIAFGDVSREVVALLSDKPTLSRGRTIFECTMVSEGYGKWVQLSNVPSNPYMCTRMSRCGVPQPRRT